MKTLQKLFALFLLLCAFSQVCGCIFRRSENYLIFCEYSDSGRAEELLEERITQIIAHLENAGILTDEVTIEHEKRHEIYYEWDLKRCYFYRRFFVSFPDRSLSSARFTVYFYPFSVMGEEEADRFSLTMGCSFCPAASPEAIDFDYGPNADLLRVFLSLFNVKTTAEDLCYYTDEEYLIGKIRESSSRWTESWPDGWLSIYDSFLLSPSVSLLSGVDIYRSPKDPSVSTSYHLFLQMDESHWRFPAEVRKAKSDVQGERK